MKHNAAPSARESLENSSTRAGETLPSGSRLTLEGIRSLAQEISDINKQHLDNTVRCEMIGARAVEIIREVEGLIEQVKDREAAIYQWASGQ